MRHGPTARAARLSLLALVVAACGDDVPAAPERTPKSLEIGSVSWSAVGSAGQEISRDEFTQTARRSLADVPDPGGAARRGAILQGSFDTTAGEGAMVLEARIPSSAAGVPITATLVATGKAESADDARALMRKGLQDLASALRALVSLARGSTEQWLRAVDSAEPDEQRLAVELLGKHKVASAVPRLAGLLSDPREPVAEAAADALVAIGDPSAVPLLIKSIKRGDLRSEVRAIEAMGRLGGPEAEAYLEMTAGGHEVEEVRQMSARALEGLRRSK
jgi:hypothetical protein